jgi:large conductance mechanosensitive channel
MSDVVKGLKNFLLRGDVIVIAVGLIVALAFSKLISGFTNDVINPIITRLQGKSAIGLGIQLGTTGERATFINLGALISTIVYFVVYMAVIYFVIVQPYKAVSARRGVTVFGDPAPVKTCPACQSCGSEV